MLRAALIALGLWAAPILWAAPVLWTPPVAAQELVTGISTENIALTANFTGSEVLVFGAIRRDAPIPPGQSPVDVVITLTGPDRNVVVRRKDRRFGIWLNAEEIVVRRVPSYYAMAGTRPIAEILSETERLRYEIGLEQTVRRTGAHPDVADTAPFTQALVRLRLEDGLFVDKPDGVDLAQETLFQTRFRLPTNLVEGSYTTDFFLVRDKAVISSGAMTITVQKEGIERWLYNLSQQRPLLYGLMSVAIALFCGWTAAWAFAYARR